MMSHGEAQLEGMRRTYGLVPARAPRLRTGPTEPVFPGRLMRSRREAMMSAARWGKGEG